MAHEEEIVENNIIKMPSYKYALNPRGIACEIFDCMKANKQAVAQIEADTGKSETYEQELQKCIRAAIKLRERGITYNDFVCICTFNHLNTCVPYLAAILIGAMVCAIEPALSHDYYKHILSLIQPKIIFVIPESMEMCKKIIEELSLKCELILYDSDEFQHFLQESPEEENFKPEKTKCLCRDVMIIFTSGTTGKPKGINLNHYDLMHCPRQFISFGFSTSTMFSISSLYWLSGVLTVLISIFECNSRLLCKDARSVDVWALVNQYRPSFLFLPPLHAVLLTKTGIPEHADTTCLKSVIISGAAMTVNNFIAFRNLLPGIDVMQMYGLTEVSGMALAFTPATKPLNKPASAGKPIHGFWYKVTDLETGEALGCNCVGELRLKSEVQIKGYYKDDNTTKLLDSDGFVKTGDACYYDEDHCFFILDRIEHMMKIDGQYVTSSLLEGVLMEHPCVKIAVVVGIPDPVKGHLPVAVVVLLANAGNITPEELAEYVNGKVKEHEKVGRVKFVDSIPLTPSEKPQKHKIRDQILAELNM